MIPDDIKKKLDECYQERLKTGMGFVPGEVGAKIACEYYQSQIEALEKEKKDIIKYWSDIFVKMRDEILSKDQAISELQSEVERLEDTIEQLKLFSENNRQ